MTLDVNTEKAIVTLQEDFPSQWMQYKECLQQSQESSASIESDHLIRNNIMKDAQHWNLDPFNEKINNDTKGRFSMGIEDRDHFVFKADPYAVNSQRNYEEIGKQKKIVLK